MALKYKRVGITVKSDFGEKDEVVRRVLAILDEAGAKVLCDRPRVKGLSCAAKMPGFSTVKDIDLLLVLGGDGTILRCVRELENFSVPVLSINRGNIGFLAEMNLDEVDALLPKFLRGEGMIDERSVLKIVARRKKKILTQSCVLNEAVISQGSIARLIDLKTMVNDEELTTFRADGLILSTPTGSTAYTLAAGGPIVHPSLSAMILTPINSHAFSQKPIVIPGTHTVSVEVMSKVSKFHHLDVSLTLDGQTYVTLERGDVIEASMSKQTVKFLRRTGETFYPTLRTKLKWGRRPEE